MFGLHLRVTCFFLLLAFSPIGVFTQDGLEVRFLSVKDSSGTKATSNGECLSRGGYLAMDYSPAAHSAIQEAIALVTNGDYNAFLGGSLNPSRRLGCPETFDYEPSLKCFWFWDEGVFAGTDFRFYRGNLHPNKNRNGPGLTGAGPMPGMSSYWLTSGNEQLYPAERFLYNIMLVKNSQTLNMWVDNDYGPGFSYGPTGLNIFYAACQFGAVPPPDLSFPPIYDSSDSYLKNSTNEENKLTGSQIGLLVGFIAIGIIFLVLFFVCCCCREKFLACLCPDKWKHRDGGSDTDSELSAKSSRGSKTARGSRNIKRNGSFSQGGSQGILGRNGSTVSLGSRRNSQVTFILAGDKHSFYATQGNEPSITRTSSNNSLNSQVNNQGSSNHLTRRNSRELYWDSDSDSD